ncbi:MAG TPA: hypothetical protein VFC44_10240 [Candidatus Saccharimonadales bacterium]|nr:hypothetical protein [Candidatus Saccharimonadales bacterium]
MSKKQQFLGFVLAGAVAQEAGEKTSDTELIMEIAGQIPEERIPANIMNAARVFLAFCHGESKRPHRWMLGRAK